MTMISGEVYITMLFLPICVANLCNQGVNLNAVRMYTVLSSFTFMASKEK